MPQRLEDWPRRLSDYIRQRRHLPFAWGTNDCATFAFGGADELTGASAVGRLGDYNSQFGANRNLVRLGCRNVIDLADRLLGPRLAKAAFASRGDVVSFMGTPAVTLGLCVGVAIAAPGPSGVLFLPRAVATIGWKVG